MLNIFEYAGSLLRRGKTSFTRVSLTPPRVQVSHKNPPSGQSFILPTRDAFELLSTCIRSLVLSVEAEEIEFEVIIIDNRTSEKKALEFLEKLSQRDYIKVVRYNRSFNYAEMINIGATLARYPTVVTINNDLEFSAIKTFGPLIRHILDPTIGVVAPVLTNRDGSIQSSGIRLGYKGVAGHVSQPIGQCAQVSAVSFAVAMFRKKDFFDLAGLDQRFKVGLNDVDFCLRIQQKGLRIAICAESSVFHAGSASRGSSFQIKRIFRASIEVLRFMKLYPKLEDPFLRQVS